MLFSIHILQRQADASAMADSRFMPKYRQKNNLRHVIASEVKRLGEKIRTSGLLNPIQARYQTAPHPVNEGYYTTFRGQKQALLAKNLRDFAPANAKRRYLALHRRHHVYNPSIAANTHSSIQPAIVLRWALCPAASQISLTIRLRVYASVLTLCSQSQPIRPAARFALSHNLARR